MYWGGVLIKPAKLDMLCSFRDVLVRSFCSKTWGYFTKWALGLNKPTWESWRNITGVSSSVNQQLWPKEGSILLERTYLKVESHWRQFQFGQGIIKNLRIVEIQSLPSTIPLSQDGTKCMLGRAFDDLAFPKIMSSFCFKDMSCHSISSGKLRRHIPWTNQNYKNFWTILPHVYIGALLENLAWTHSPIEAVSHCFPYPARNKSIFLAFSRKNASLWGNGFGTFSSTLRAQQVWALPNGDFKGTVYVGILLKSSHMTNLEFACSINASRSIWES